MKAEYPFEYVCSQLYVQSVLLFLSCGEGELARGRFQGTVVERVTGGKCAISAKYRCGAMVARIEDNTRETRTMMVQCRYGEQTTFRRAPEVSSILFQVEVVTACVIREGGAIQVVNVGRRHQVLLLAGYWMNSKRMGCRSSQPVIEYEPLDYARVYRDGSRLGCEKV